MTAPDTLPRFGREGYAVARGAAKNSQSTAPKLGGDTVGDPLLKGAKTLQVIADGRTDLFVRLSQIHRFACKARSVPVGFTKSITSFLTQHTEVFGAFLKRRQKEPPIQRNVSFFRAIVDVLSH